MTTDDLIAALEKAEGPSRELDKAIALAVGWTLYAPHGGIWWKRPNGEWALGPEMFTSSIDAALTLVPARACWEVREDLDRIYRAAVWVVNDPAVYGDSPGSAAIAICIAALRAREAAA